MAIIAAAAKRARDKPKKALYDLGMGFKNIIGELCRQVEEKKLQNQDQGEPTMNKQSHYEGLKVARLLMVLSSISPLFILWAIRGSSLISDRYFLVFCALMVIIPNAFLWFRIMTARKLQERRELIIGASEDHREHLLVYLFAMLLPFYTENLSTWRTFGSALAALGFIVFLFWHLNLHYMNVLFAALGYRVFTIYPPADGNPLNGRTSQVLITRRVTVSNGDRVAAYRVSDTVYFEVNE